MAYNNDKTEHAFRTFAQDMKSGEEYPVIFMYGTEDYLIEWAVSLLVKRYVGKGAESMDFQRPDPNDLTIDDIISQCETFSMFSEKRVLWIKDLPALTNDNAKGFGEKQLKLLEEYFAQPNLGTVLVFSSSQVRNDPKDRREKKSKLDKLLLKEARCYDFCPLDRKALKAFIDKRLRSSGLLISREDMDYLVDSTGYYHKETEYRLMNLTKDLEKITGLKADDNRVTREDIDRAILGDMETYVFDFLDHVSSNRKEEAFLLLNNMLSSGTDVFGILALLVNQFEMMVEIRELAAEGYDLKAISRELGMHEFRIKKAMASANRLSLDKLKTTLMQLYETDTQIKQGNIDGTLALELIIGRI